MIKNGLIEGLYRRHGGVTRKESELYINTMLELMRAQLEAGENVSIAKFGTFRHKHRNVRKIVLPSGEEQETTGEPRVQFLPSPAMKAFINDDES